MTIFDTPNFTFPYTNSRFPGQHEEETILFITREASIVLNLRWVGVVASGLIMLFVRTLVNSILTNFAPTSVTAAFNQISLIGTLLFVVVALWWVYITWQKSVFIITTRRLTKFIYTTPFNRYQLSLGLDKIVDTGAYQKGLVQSLFHLGYFVARSSAGNIKNFKIINIEFAEDLHNYVNKLLFTFTREKDKLDRFRPFIAKPSGQRSA